MRTNCENCSREMDDDEVQQCDLCGMDGLCDRCIGECDHECEVE